MLIYRKTANKSDENSKTLGIKGPFGGLKFIHTITHQYTSILKIPKTGFFLKVYKLTVT